MNAERKTGAPSSAAEHSALMRKMGSKDGAWNPMPPEQHLTLLRPDVKMTPNAHRVVAWVIWKTVQLKRGGRTPQAHDERGDLRLVHMASDLGWVDLSNALKYAIEAEQNGFIRRDDNGVFWLCANVLASGMYATTKNASTEEPEEADDVCTHQLPKYVSERLQQLSSENRRKFLTGWRRAEERSKAAQADAVAIIREREFEEQNRLCKELLNTELQTGKKRRDPKRKLAVQLTFADDVADGAVHTSETAAENGYVQHAESTSYNVEKKAVQTSASLLTSENREQRESSSSIPAVRAALNDYGTADDDAAKTILDACRAEAPEATPADVVRVIHAKGKQIAGRRNVKNAIGLLLTAVPKVFMSDDWRPLRAPVKSPQHPNYSVEAHIAELRTSVTALQESGMDAVYLAQLEAELEKELAKLNGHAKGAGA